MSRPSAIAPDQPGSQDEGAAIGRAWELRGVVARPGNDALTPDDLVSTDGNRWSRPGEPTIYLGSDSGVALAEFARHLTVGAPPPVGRLWTVEVHLDRVVDLRTSAARARASVAAERDWPLERETCRSIATRLRDRGVQGLIVPSVAFLDQP